MTAAAGAILRFRYAVVAFWLCAAVAATLLLPNLRQAGGGSLGELVPTDADAIDAELRSNELFRFPLLSRTVVVQRDVDGLSAASQGRAVRRLVRLNADALPGLEAVAFALGLSNSLGKPPFSRERSTTALTYLFFMPDIGYSGQTGLAHRFVERYVNRPGDAAVGVTGAAPARAEQVRLINDALPLVELVTLILVSVALALHFRALGAPLGNLVAVALAYLIAVRVVAGAGRLVGVTIPEEVGPVVVVLLFGIITDYSIFFLSRFRRELGEGLESIEAARRTTAGLLGIILAAGISVAAACGALVVARLGFYEAFGPGLALSVLVALAVATTFVPALLAIAGERLFWPGIRGPAGTAAGREDRGSGVVARLLALPSRRPLAVVIATTVPLLLLSTGLMRLEVGNPVIRSLPSAAEPRVAYAAASKGFAPGVLSPTVVIVEGDGVAEQRDALARLQGLIARRPAIAAVVGPRQLSSPANLGAVFSETADAVRYFVVLDANPLGGRAIGIVRRLRGRMPQMLARVGLGSASASFAGDTALSEETVTKTKQDVGRMLPATSLAVFVVLALLLRALVAPVYLVATSLLALAASLGLTVYFFQGVLGYGELAFYVPFAATVLLLALGSDYNIFLVARIWNEARRRPLRDAVTVAGRRAAATITVAGLVLSLSFATLALVPLAPFRQLAFALSTGLLIDAFVVRSLLAPALISLVGERSGWPGRSLKRSQSQ